MGTFVVDEVRVCNPPRVISIRGNSADLQSDRVKQRTRLHYEDATVGEVVGDLAGEMGYTAAIHPDLGPRPVPVLDRVTESPMNAVTRLARRFDAVATVKQGHLTFVPAGVGETASGAPIPEVEILESNCTRWCFERVDRGKYTAAKARYHDFDAAEDKWVEAGRDDSIDASATYELRATYPDEESALEAARGKIRALVRNEGGANLTHVGDPTIGAQAPLVLRDFGAGIDGRWIADEVTHRIDNSGFVTTIRAKLPAD
jgi:phage protein D